MFRLSKKQREELKNKYDGNCAYCGYELGDKWHADHLKAVRRDFKGGCNRPENDCIDNFMPACISCNLSKSGYDLEQWRKTIKNYIKVIERNTPTYRISKRYGLVEEIDKDVIFYFETYEGYNIDK